MDTTNKNKHLSKIQPVQRAIRKCEINYSYSVLRKQVFEYFLKPILLMICCLVAGHLQTTMI
jgi:hypothetical protein